MAKPNTGKIGWIDLTVPDAPQIRDFYSSVAGWAVSNVKMDGYDDFCMHPSPESQPVAGVCHARGPNQDLPAQWLIYITVADLESSLETCEKLGGTTIQPIREMGDARMAVIQDPAGAVCALYEESAG